MPVLREHSDEGALMDLKLLAEAAESLSYKAARVGDSQGAVFYIRVAELVRRYQTIKDAKASSPDPENGCV